MKRALPFIALLALAGCAIGPDYRRPEIELAAEFQGQKLESVQGSEIDTRWWRSLGDPLLAELVERALNQNLTIEAALARLNRSRALRNEAFYDLGPSGNATAGYVNRQDSLAQLEGIPDPERTRETYSAGFDALWELDVLGRGRRNYESKIAEEAASVADFHNTLITVAAEVARNYFELRGLQRDLEVTVENGELQKESTRIIDEQADRGEISALDQARARSQLFQTQALVDPIRAQIKAVIFRLGVLLGREPSALEELLSERKPIPPYTGPLSIGNPTEMVRRRPDIRAAEMKLASATASKGVALGGFFPRLTFSGTFAWEAMEPHDLGTSASTAFSFGPRISWAILDFGRVWARVEEADQRILESLVNYRHQILLALEDVEGSLARYGGERSRRALLLKAVEQGNEAVRLSQLRYKEGLDDFLTLLEAQRTKLIVELELVRSEKQLALNMISIFKSLGGGWEAAELTEGKGEESAEATAVPEPSPDPPGA